ncbi:unnamed protein product [Sphagnum compactum]
MAHSLLGAECYLSVSAVLVRSSSSLIAELSSPTSEVLNSINKVQTEVVWQISMLDDVKSDMEEMITFIRLTETPGSKYSNSDPNGMDGATCVPCGKCLALILRLANVADPSTATELAKACCFSQVLMPGQGCLVDLKHVVVNNLVRHGGIKQILTTYQCKEPVIVDLPQRSGCSLMEMVNVKAAQVCKEKCEYNSWLLDMLQNHFVAS